MLSQVLVQDGFGLSLTFFMPVHDAYTCQLFFRQFKFKFSKPIRSRYFYFSHLKSGWISPFFPCCHLLLAWMLIIYPRQGISQSCNVM